MTKDIALVAAPGFYIVKPLEEKQVADFIIPDTANQKDYAGEVLAVGDPVSTEYGAMIDPVYKVGDLVIHRPYAMHPYKHEGMDLRFIRFQDVMGKHKKEKHG